MHPTTASLYQLYGAPFTHIAGADGSWLYIESHANPVSLIPGTSPVFGWDEPGLWKGAKSAKLRIQHGARLWLTLPTATGAQGRSSLGP